jgi:aspartyl protease family protein
MPIYGWVAAGILITGLVVLLLGGNNGTLLGVDPGQLAAVTAMLALLVYLGGGVFTRGQPVAPLLRHLLIWGGLLALLLVGYWVFQDFFA